MRRKYHIYHILDGFLVGLSLGVGITIMGTLLILNS